MDADRARFYKAGLGNGFSLAVLPSYRRQFYRAAHLDRWLALGSLPPVSLLNIRRRNRARGAARRAWRTRTWLWHKRKRNDTRWQGRDLFCSRVACGVRRVEFIIAGQPWGSSTDSAYGAPKIATWFGSDLAPTPIGETSAHRLRIESSLLTDITSVTNLGLLIVR